MNELKCRFVSSERSMFGRGIKPVRLHSFRLEAKNGIQAVLEGYRSIAPAYPDFKHVLHNYRA